MDYIGAQIQNALNWTVNDDNLKHFMSLVPQQHKEHMNFLALEYIFNNKDESSQPDKRKALQILDSDVGKIKNIFPARNSTDLRKRLLALGTLRNRVEVVLRQIVTEMRDSINIDLNLTTSKRKSPEPVCLENEKRVRLNNQCQSVYDAPSTSREIGFNFANACGFNYPNVPSTKEESQNDHPLDIFSEIEENYFNSSVPEMPVNSEILQEPQKPTILPHSPNIPKEEKHEETKNDLVSFFITPKSFTNEVISISSDEDTVFVEPEINDSVQRTLYSKLQEMFPKAALEYLKNLVKGKTLGDFDALVSEILDGEYPERTISPEREITDPAEQFDTLKELFPDMDPTYLRMQCDALTGKPEELKLFINRALENRSYPTMKEYLRKEKLSAQQKQYTTDFKVKDFVDLFPDPKETFQGKNRNYKMDRESRHYLLTFFKNKYPKLSVARISAIVTEKENKVMDIKLSLDAEMNNGNFLKSRRRTVPLPTNMQNIPLLQDIAYVEHEEEILLFLRVKEEILVQNKLKAKMLGLLESCQCCFDEEVMPEDIFCCIKGCKFCKGCIQKSVEIAMGEAKYDFPCLECDSSFTMTILQKALESKLFSKLAQKKAAADIRASGMEDVEFCPFCDFATIPDENDRVFKCLNQDCMKESCRLCKEPSHIPLRCDELEHDEHVKARTYVENQMTEALLVTCYKCNTKFFKEEGCNKMTCTCGAQMCYLCQKPVTDYKHFNGLGGDNFHLCPLYSDTVKLHEQKVMAAAENAKAGIDPNKLKIDPTVDVKKHFEERAKKVQPPPPAINAPLLEQNFLEEFLDRDIDPWLQNLRRYVDRERHRHRHPNHHRRRRM